MLSLALNTVASLRRIVRIRKSGGVAQECRSFASLSMTSRIGMESTDTD